MNQEDAEETVSMLDVLEEDTALEEEANAVLGGSDDQNCTYPNGYINRQALYACMTCTGLDTQPAGVCLACCLHCHDKHELVELYTKRNFRCDCGNNRFKNFECKLYKDKEKNNVSNKYNQNFKGTYCTCKRPYPDEEEEVEDEMIQCIICEDWYHSRHLGVLPPADYMELICDSCVKKHDFLYHYKSVCVPSGLKTPSQQILKKEDTKEDVDIINQVDSESKIEVEIKGETSTNKTSPDKAGSSNSDSLSKNESSSAGACKLESLKSGKTKSPRKTTALFWPSQWRRLLCKCDACMDMYKEGDVAFLVDETDTLEEYERKAKAQSKDSYDDAMNAMGRMGRVQQVEMVQGFNDMRAELSDYLKGFADEGKVVKKEDIESFFEGLRARKRRRVDDGVGIQMNCR